MLRKFNPSLVGLVEILAGLLIIVTYTYLNPPSMFEEHLRHLMLPQMNESVLYYTRF
jgi:hypothetical protein